MRVVLADDQALLRESLAEALAARGSTSWARPRTSRACSRSSSETRPDVAIVDIRMPPSHTVEGLEAASTIRATWPDVAVLLLSHHVETAIAVDLLRDDPRGLGYLLKDRVSSIDALVDALDRLAAGGVVIDPEIVSRLLGPPPGPRPDGRVDRLVSATSSPRWPKGDPTSDRGAPRHRGQDRRVPRHADPRQARHRARRQPTTGASWR